MNTLRVATVVVCVAMAASAAMAQIGGGGESNGLFPRTRAEYEALTFDHKLRIYRLIAADERLDKLERISIRDILEGNREAAGYEELYRWLPISPMDLFKIENFLRKHEVVVPRYRWEAHQRWLKVHFGGASGERGDGATEAVREARVAELKATVGTNRNAATDHAPPPTEYQGEIQIAVNKNNPLQMVAGANTWNTLCGYGMQDVFYSSDGGVTWGYTCTPVGTDYTALSGYSCPYEFGSDPAIYWNDSDEVFFEYMAICYRVVSGRYREHYAMVVAKSVNGGATWQPFSVLQNSWDNYNILEDKNFYIIDTVSSGSYAGRHYSCWDRNNDELFKWSDDGGVSWNEVDLPDTPTLDLGCEMAVEDDGTVHVIFDTLTCGVTYCTDEDMYYTRSTNGGANWSQPLVHLHDFTNLISFGSQASPAVQDDRGLNPFGAIDVDNSGGDCDGYLYVCFADDADGDGAATADIFVVRSPDGGDSWANLAAPVKVNDDATTRIQFHPFLVVDQVTGDVIVTWHDARNYASNAQVDFFIARSTDCGATFEANVQVSQLSDEFNNNAISYSNMSSVYNTEYNPNQYAEYMGLDAHDGTAYVAWADTRHYYPGSTSESEKDNMGFATVEFTTTCSPLTCSGISIDANPVCDGTAQQLTAGYSGGVSSFTVAWDLDNDGQYDDGTGNPITHTFAAGTHTVGVRVTDSCPLGAQTCTASTTVSVDEDPSQPVIGTITDEDACAQSGIRVPYTAGSPVDHHELWRSGVQVDASYASNELYNPASTSSFSYVVRAVNGTCSTDSESASFADADTTPGAPAIIGVTDPDSCAQSGIQVSFTAGSGATRHVLVRGATEVADPYTSGQLYDPGDTATYQYSVRAYNGSCSADSGQLPGTDSDDCSCTTAPTFAGLESVTPITGTSACGLRLTWSAPTAVPCGGPVVYNVYRSTSPGFTPDPDTNLLPTGSCLTGTTFDDTSVAIDQAYSYVVRAEDGTAWGTGPCNSGNETTNDVEAGNTVASVTRTGTQLTDPLTASGSTETTNLGSVDVVSATSATLVYDRSYTPSTSDEIATQPTQIGVRNGTTTSPLNPAFTIPGVSATSAVVDSWSLTGNTDLTACVAIRLRSPGGSETTLKAAGTADPGFATVTGFYQTEGPGTYTIVLQELAGCANWNRYAYLSGARMVVQSGGGAGTDWQTDVEVWLVDPQATATQLKNLGDPDTGTWPVTAYYTGAGTYQVQLVEASGGTAEMSNAELQVQGTTCSTAGVDDVSFFTATGGFDGVGTRQMVLEWVNPYVGSASGYTTRICGSTTGFPADPATCTQVYEGAPASGTFDSFTYTAGLSAGQIYYYTAFVVRDVSGVDHISKGRRVFARALDQSTGDVKWAFSTGASALAPPGLGSVYGVSNDRNLHSMASGDLGGDWPSSWMPKAMNAPAQGRPPVVTFPAGAAFDDAKVVFLGSQDGYVYAVDANSGSQLWERDLGAMVQAAPAGIFSHWDWGPEPHYDLVLVGTRAAGADNSFRALNVADGTAAWSFSGDATHGAIGIISGAAEVDYETKRVIFASRERSDTDDTTLWCLSFTDSTAAVVWAKALGDIDGSPSVRDGVVYVGTNASRVYALDADTGDYIWPSPYYHDCEDGPVKGFVAPVHGSSDLMLSTSSTVWRLTDGGSSGASVAWSSTAIDSPSEPLPAPGSTLAFVGSGDGLLYQIDFSAGPAVASEQLGDAGSPAAVGSPALDVVNDLVYVGTEEGIVYAVSVPLS